MPPGRIESINAFTTSQSYEDAAMPRLNSSHAASEDFVFGVGGDTSDIAGPHSAVLMVLNITVYGALAMV